MNRHVCNRRENECELQVCLPLAVVSILAQQCDSHSAIASSFHRSAAAVACTLISAAQSDAVVAVSLCSSDHATSCSSCSDAYHCMLHVNLPCFATWVITSHQLVHHAQSFFSTLECLASVGSLSACQLPLIRHHDHTRHLIDHHQSSSIIIDHQGLRFTLRRQ